MAPTADRPFMPGYGVPASSDGLLAWSWAEERLARSHDYWFATVHPAGRPHVMPVWGVLLDGHLWCSTGPMSRKAVNLHANPAVSVTTDDPAEPVVVEGVAVVVADDEVVEQFAVAMDSKVRHGVWVGVLLGESPGSGDTSAGVRDRHRGVRGEPDAMAVLSVEVLV